MTVACPHCSSSYNLDDSRIPAAGLTMRCPRCGNNFSVSLEGAAPLPGAGAPVPLPGSAAAPRSAASGAVPLPGGPGAQRVPPPVPAAPRGAPSGPVPLPGNRGAVPPAVPRAAGSGAVPLPGTARPPPAASPSGPRPAPPARAAGGSGSVPLPAGTQRPGPPAAPRGAPSGAVPLPGGGRPAAPLPPGQRSYPTGAVPPQASGRQTINWESPTAFEQMPQAPGGEDIPNFFDEPPTSVASPQAPEAPSAFEAPAGGDLTFETAVPGDDAASLFETAPGARAVPTPPPLDLNTDLGFDVSTNVLPPPPAPGPGPADQDSRRFLEDPTGEGETQRPKAAAPAAAAEDGLEVLDFIDEAAPSKASAGPSLSATMASPAPREKRYQVRKRSGKAFGPYDESTVVQMLREGKLLGNEEVTTDGDHWVVISSVPLMAAVIEELMASPGGLNIPLPGEAGGEEHRSNDPETLRRLQDLYGGRMASSAIVESVDHVANFKKRLPFIIAGAVLLLVLVIGTWLAFTPYGFFGVYAIAGPPHVSRSGAAAKMLEQARAEIAKDTYPAYRQALQLAERAEAAAPRAVEPPAVAAQAVFYLQRRFSQTVPEAAAARAKLDRWSVVGKKEPDVIEANAGLEAVLGQSASTRPALEALLSKRPKDPELLYLLAESWFAQDPKRAAGYLHQMAAADPKS
ncbi:MAG TPA: zinc-ribbon domain-containing protein, partial [Myxococcales bacterium]|nr:zinc-ribbon domain-containing protein [Myxococcales bacterium]